MGEAKRRRELGTIKANIDQQANELVELFQKGGKQAIQQWCIEIILSDGEYRLNRVFDYMIKHHRDVAINFVRKPTIPINLVRQPRAS